jgi:23S rRNA pseudouridine2605 synthase
MEKSTVRLNKFLAEQGFDSRRNIAIFLAENEVLINGTKVTEPGVRIDPKKDQVMVNGKLLSKQKGLVYFLLNKPKGVISTAKDEHGRQTVVDLIKTKERIYPIGRLDENTKGALILTNDGALTQKLTHPKFHIDKTYVCLVVGKVRTAQLESLRNGVDLKDGKTLPAEIEVLEEKPQRTILQLVIREGKNHQIKRMLAKVGLELLELKRTSIGALGLGELKIGEYRPLKTAEVKLLHS